MRSIDCLAKFQILSNVYQKIMAVSRYEPGAGLRAAKTLLRRHATVGPINYLLHSVPIGFSARQRLHPDEDGPVKDCIDFVLIEEEADGQEAVGRVSRPAVGQGSDETRTGS